MNNPQPDPSISQTPEAGQGMPPTVQARLLDLNRAFYQAVGGEFDRTRQGLPPGMVELAARLAAHAAGRRGDPAPLLRVLDVGCGNGRLARALAQGGVPCDYTGIDADAQLLAFAAEQTQGLAHITAHFARIDIANPGWAAALPAHGYDVVACLAVLHHFPGLALRGRLVQELAGLLADDGVLALSTWQFLNSERLAQKQADWAAVGVDAAAVEPGDALLPWNQGVHALRYVHQLDLPEVAALAAAAGLRRLALFHADGKENNLNLYTLWARGA
jgi:2-polyprenyl-3-methyl-5-hydroxy-6-metoxy-1,4-benzoquinol methylase